MSDNSCNAANESPRHVAFIMDGNGRWATARGLLRGMGHQAGAETVRRVAAFAMRQGIPYITLYAFSTENWSRPQEEVAALMGLMAAFVHSELPVLLENGIRLRIIGDVSPLPEALQQEFAQAVAATAHNCKLTLTLAVNYGGRDEIIRATRKAVRILLESGGKAGDVNADLFESCLDTAGLPDPDLLVRTAGEMRISNFLLWQNAYAEFVFVKRCWPDFSDEDFAETLAVYRERVRKFGGSV